MKNNYLFRPFKKGLIAVMTVLAGTTLAQIPTTNLSAYWPMEGTAQDISGNNNNGTVNGATLTTDRFGRTNAAYQFTGTSQNITVPSNSTTNLAKPFSLSIWCYNNGGSQTLFRKGGEWGIDFDGSSVAGQPNKLAFFSLKSNQSLDVYPTTATFPINTWMHIVAVFNNTATNNVSIYVNNSLVLTGTGSTTNYASTSNITIGAYNLIPNAPEAYNGKIDDIRIYKKALTSSEITSLYNEQTPITNLTFSAGTPATGLPLCNNSSYTTTNIVVTHTIPVGTPISYYLVDNAGNSFLCGTQTIVASPATVGLSIPPTVPVGNGYKLKLTCANPLFEYTNSATINVYNLPAPTITNTSPLSVCPGSSVTLNSTCSFSSSVYTWKLNYNNVAGNTSNPQNLTTASTGTFAVYYVDQNRCAVKSNDVVINNATAPAKAIITRTDNIGNCQGYNRSFQITTVSGETYQWYINNIAITGATASSLTVAPYGFNNGANTITVSATNVNGCITVSDPFNININPNPSAPVITANQTPICTYPVTLSTNYSSVYWFKDAYLQSPTSGQTRNATASGNYMAYYIDNNTGCASALGYFNIAPFTPISLSITGNTEICPGTSTILNAGSGYTSYTWNNGAHVQQMSATAGTYSVTVSDSRGCTANASATVINSNACTNLPCGMSFDKMATAIYASSPSMPASQIKNYIFKLYNLQNTLIGTFVNTSNVLLLQSFPGIKYNTSYKWSVQIEYYVPNGTAFAPESTPCPVTMLPPATTVPCNSYYPGLSYSASVTPPSTNSTMSQIIAYKFTFYNLGGGYLTSKIQPSNTLYFNTVAGLHNNDDFLWSVQIQYVNGTTSAWGPETTPCLIMFGSSLMKTKQDSDNNIEAANTTRKKDSLIDPLPHNGRLSLYPNPSSTGNVTIDFDLGTNYADVIITDITGRIVFSKEHIEAMETLSTSELQKGLYVITIKNNNKSISKKLILE